MGSVFLILLFFSCTIACAPALSGGTLYTTVTNGVWSANLAGINPGDTVITACVTSGVVGNRPTGITQVAYMPLVGSQKFSVFVGVSTGTTMYWTIQSSATQMYCVAQAYSGVRYTGLAGSVGGTLNAPPISWSGLAITVGATTGTGFGTPTNAGATSVQSGTTADRTLAVGLASFPGYTAGSATTPFVISGTSTTASYAARLLFDTC